MSQDSERSIALNRIGKGRFEATNARGVKLPIGGEEDFSPVDLLLAAIAACSAMDVDAITSKRAEPTRFDVRMRGDKIRDDEGNRLVNLRLSFDVAFGDDEGGRAAAAVLDRAVRQSHDRLCTVSRTVEVASPIDVDVS